MMLGRRWVCCCGQHQQLDPHHRHQPPKHCCPPPPCCPCPSLPSPPLPPLQRYPISGYIKLPAALQPFVQLPIMDHVIVVAKPSGDISGGLENYREVGAA